MTKEELTALIEDCGYDNALLLCPEFLSSAAIGTTSYGAVVYSREKLIDCYAREYAKTDGFDFDSLDPEKQGEYEQEASEQISYNVEGAIYNNLPYENGTIPPIICDMFD